MNKSWLSLLVLCLGPFLLFANDYYAVQVGVFLNPRLSDFSSIENLGFLYAEQDAGNTYRIFVGDFDDVREAENVERRLKQKGYMDAFVAIRSTKLGQPVAVIQMATRQFKDKINWEPFFKVGNVFVLAEDSQIKIVTGPYRDMNEAKADLNKVRTNGFSDAFPKMVNNARLHELNSFELGDYKQALIPIAFDTERERASTDLRTKGQQRTDREMIAYDNSVSNRLPARTVNEPTATAVNFDLAVPSIRTNVKRQSVMDLQRALKDMGTYKSSLDGYYGDGTASGFERAANAHPTFKKYLVLSKYAFPVSGNTQLSNLQNALNNLPNNAAGSLIALEGDNSPLAKAYRAYWLFQTNGASRSVNDLMNTAIVEAYNRQPRNSLNSNVLPIDPRSTYAYQEANQIVRHIAYLHQMQNNIYLPCWMMTRHANELSSAMNSAAYSYYVADDCNGFYQWEVARVLKTLAEDIGTGGLTQDGATLSRLYLSPNALSQIEVQGLTAWNDLLWQNLSVWESRDPLHLKIVSAMQLAYYQTQVQLEDHFMDKGFSAPQAKGLALATLKAMIGNHVERFM